MSYSNQQIAQLIAQSLSKNKQPIFQKGYTTSTGINRQINVNVGGKVVRALGWNVDTPGEVNVFWDAQNKRYVAWKEDTHSLKRKVLLSKRKVRPTDDKKITILYNFVVAQDGGLLEGFSADENLNLSDYTVKNIINVGDNYFSVYKLSNNSYAFSNNTGNVLVTISNSDFANNSFYINDFYLSAYKTQTTVSVIPTIYYTSNGGGTLYNGTFFPSTPRYAGNIPQGYLPNDDYYIENDTCTTTYILKAVDNVNRGNINQVITHSLTGRTDTPTLWDYTYAGSYTIPHQRATLCVDGYTLDNQNENVNIDVVSSRTFQETATERIQTTSTTYNNSRVSSYDLGTASNPIYDIQYNISAQGSINQVIKKPRLYKINVRILNTYLEPVWGGDGWPSPGNTWDPILEGTISTVVVVVSGSFYSTTPTFPIAYTIESESFTFNAGDQTTYYLRKTDDFYPIGTDWFDLWKAATRIKLNNEISYHFIESQAGFLFPTGYFYVTGAPNISIEYDPPEEIYSDSVRLYDDSYSIVGNSSVVTVTENYSFQNTQNSSMLNNVNCVMYQQSINNLTQQYIYNYSQTYPNTSGSVFTFERYEETTYANPQITYLVVAIKNNAYYITDWKNNTIDAEDRFAFFTYDNNYSLEVGSVTFEGYSMCGIYNNYATYASNDAPIKKEKRVFQNTYNETSTNEVLSRFTVNTFNWVSKEVVIFQSVGGQVIKAIGSVSSADDSASPNEITVSISEVTTETYQIVSEDYVNGLIISSAADYTMMLVEYFNNYKTQANLYLTADENGLDILELAIAQIPTDTVKQKEHYADIYRFNTTSLKWERRPNGVSSLSQLSEIPEHISYHPTPINKERKKRF
jgi:hypothetical protein